MEIEMQDIPLRRAEATTLVASVRSVLRPASVSFAPSVQSEIELKAQKNRLDRAKTLSVNGRPIKMKPSIERRLRRHESIIALEELVECGICLSRLVDPKMLHCQHTFCYGCLKSMLKQANDSENVEHSQKSIECPVCKQKSNVDNIDALPTNLYINNLISLLINETEEVSVVTTGKPGGDTIKCAMCNTICQEQNIVKCQHCKMDFCSVCFQQHADELTSRYSDFLRQLDDHEMSLTFEQTDYKRHCDLLAEEIKLGILQKIEELKHQEAAMLKEVATLHEAGGMEILHISAKIVNLREAIKKQNETKAHNKVINYMDFHQKMSQILDGISSLAVNYKQVNMATLKLDAPSPPESPNTTNFIYEELRSSQVNSPGMLLTYYKNKIFTPKSIYQKFQKPTGLCIAPWDRNQVYVCNMKTIYVYDIAIGKVTMRIQNDNMTCPQSITCKADTAEIFVSDKWKNMIHVFGIDGNYLRNLQPKDLSNPHGIALNKDGNLLVCDTGNDRLLIIDTTVGKIKNTIGIVDGITELSMPTDVATDGKIIVVADVGNHRIKIFDALTLRRLKEIGSLGKQKGQFRSAEVVHVDEGGFILVGDSGNRRIQIFTSQGEFVQCTGSEYKFLTISGICTNKQADIIVSDYKSKGLVRF